MYLSTVTLMLNIDADVYTFFKRSVYAYYINALLLEWFRRPTPTFKIVEYSAIVQYILVKFWKLGENQQKQIDNVLYSEYVMEALALC